MSSVRTQVAANRGLSWAADSAPGEDPAAPPGGLLGVAASVVPRVAASALLLPSR